MDERRTARRFQMQLPVEVGVESLAKGRAPAQTRDVSYRGIYFTVERDFEPGTPIEFVLTLPREVTLTSEVRVQCLGRVVRVDKLPTAGEGDGRAENGRVGVAAEIETYEFLPATS
ncbi:MAG: PilZ domain-containing protein [Terriglobia bacterium]